MIGQYTFTIPLPPSVNGMYRNVPRAGREKTKRYRQWLNTAGWELKLAGLWAVHGPVSITIHVPKSMPGDVDNRAKGILDLLVAHRRIDDDRHVQSVTVMRADTVPPRKCRVRVMPAEAEAARAA